MKRGILTVHPLDFNWEFEIPTWKKIYDLLLNLTTQIRGAKFRPDILVGVARGGWPVTRILSDLLENPMVASVKVEFYSSVVEAKGEPVITQPASAPVENKRVLIIDDVADTGKSLALVREHLRERGAVDVKIATIYHKPWSIVIPDWSERETSHWVVFPWELKETVRRVFEKCKEQAMSTEHAKEVLLHHGFDPKLMDRFLNEILEEGQ